MEALFATCAKTLIQAIGQIFSVTSLTVNDLQQMKICLQKVYYQLTYKELADFSILCNS